MLSTTKASTTAFNVRRMWRDLAWTRIRIYVAGILYRVITLFVGKGRRRIERGGISYDIDLAEGIDLSLYLFGGFQKQVLGSDWLTLDGDAVVFDVGANTGVMALNFAKALDTGTVHAFEPTQFATEKFSKNLELNPELATRIKLNQCFLSRTTSSTSSLTTSASWPVVGSTRERHPVHLGVFEELGSVPELKMDDYCENEGISRVDLVKIDVDGHELKVFEGAITTLQTFRPVVIFELGLYLLDENNARFEDIYNILNKIGYSLYELRKRTKIDSKNYLEIVPRWSTIDVVAVPTQKK